MQASAQGKNKRHRVFSGKPIVSGRVETPVLVVRHDSPEITRRDRRFGNSKAAESRSAAPNVVGTGAQLETLHDTALFFR